MDGAGLEQPHPGRDLLKPFLLPHKLATLSLGGRRINLKPRPAGEAGREPRIGDASCRGLQIERLVALRRGSAVG